MALLTVIESFAEFSTGRPEVYNAGRLVDENDPVVKGREGHFEAAEATAARVRVEQATAGPGERRARSKPAKRRTAKKAVAKKAAPAQPAKKAAAAPAKPADETPAGDDAGSASEKL